MNKTIFMAGLIFIISFQIASAEQFSVSEVFLASKDCMTPTDGPVLSYSCSGKASSFDADQRVYHCIKVTNSGTSASSVPFSFYVDGALKKTLSIPIYPGVGIRCYSYSYSTTSAGTHTFEGKIPSSSESTSFTIKTTPTTPTCNLITWYKDSDGDGYGNPSSTTSSCTKPSGYVSNSNDCNDNNAEVYKKISCSYNGNSCGSYTSCVSSCKTPPEEVPCDSIDNDCDGSIDETSCPSGSSCDPSSKSCISRCKLISNSDVNNCGGCGAKCKSGQLCISGACKTYFDPEELAASNKGIMEYQACMLNKQGIDGNKLVKDISYEALSLTSESVSLSTELVEGDPSIKLFLDKTGDAAQSGAICIVALGTAAVAAPSVIGSGAALAYAAPLCMFAASFSMELAEKMYDAHQECKIIGDRSGNAYTQSYIDQQGLEIARLNSLNIVKNILIDIAEAGVNTVFDLPDILGLNNQQATTVESMPLIEKKSTAKQHIKSLPDLYVYKVKTLDVYEMWGKCYAKLEVSVKNKGSAGVSSARWKIIYDGKGLDSGTIKNIGAGTKKISVRFPFVGKIKPIFVVDPDNAIEESDESNNERSTSKTLRCR